MNDSTNGTPQTSTIASPLEGLKRFLDLPENERLALLRSLSESERKTLSDSLRGEESSEQLYITNPIFAAMTADQKWAQEQIHLGAFDEFAGEYIGIVEKQLMGHGIDAHQLCLEIGAKLGIAPDRVVLDFVEI